MNDRPSPWPALILGILILCGWIWALAMTCQGVGRSDLPTGSYKMSYPIVGRYGARLPDKVVAGQPWLPYVATYPILALSAICMVYAATTRWRYDDSTKVVRVSSLVFLALLWGVEICVVLSYWNRSP